jgi:hypothetical protein
MPTEYKASDKKTFGDDVKNADILKLEMAREPHDPELIDYFTRLGVDQVNTIAFFRSLRDKAAFSLSQIKALQVHMDPLEVEFLEMRRAELAAEGKDPEAPFSGCTSLCDNYMRLVVSLDGKHLEEWFGMLEPKANVTHNSIAPIMDNEGKKKGLFGKKE